MTYDYTLKNPRTEWLMAQLWPTEPQPPGSAVWAILDGARDARVYDVVRYSRMERACLYAGEHPDVLLRAAPHLVRLSGSTQFPRELLTPAWGHSWGVFLTTTASLDQLRRHLRSFLRVRDERGRRLVFRYYDPRVLREYLPTCTFAERETVFGPIDSFILEGNNGASLLRFRRDGQKLAAETIALPPALSAAPAAASPEVGAGR